MIESKSKFEQELLSFLNKEFPDIPSEDKTYIQNRILDLFCAYLTVQNQGGFVKAFSLYKQPECFANNRILQIFQKYLISFEYFLKNKKLDQKLDGAYLQRANYFEASYFYETGLRGWTDKQISVLKLNTPLEGINRGYFTFQDLKKNHGNIEIDVRMQIPDNNSFIVNPSDWNNSKFQEKMTIAQYVDYISNPKEFFKKRGQQPKYLLFAVNVDMDEMKLETSRLREYLQSEIIWCSSYDGLSYLRQEILGVNVPQMYIKIKGVYTGGHQENLSVSAININHGPGNCLWITVDNEYVQELRRLVLDEYNVDILEKEGLWFKEADYFLQKKIPIKYTIQYPGDIILLGPGCLHWVRAEGDTLNTAWNFVHKSKEAYQALYERFELNKIIRYPTVIPLKNLFVDLYIHESNQVARNFLFESVDKFIKEEIQTLEKLKNRLIQKLVECNTRENENASTVLSCSQCQNEIFIYFIRYEKDSFICMNCIEDLFIKQFPSYGKKQISVCIISKYSLQVLEFLLKLPKPKCLKKACYGAYKGYTSCIYQLENYFETILNQDQVGDLDKNSDHLQAKQEEQIENSLKNMQEEELIKQKTQSLIEEENQSEKKKVLQQKEISQKQSPKQNAPQVTAQTTILAMPIREPKKRGRKPKQKPIPQDDNTFLKSMNSKLEKLEEKKQPEKIEQQEKYRNQNKDIEDKKGKSENRNSIQRKSEQRKFEQNLQESKKYEERASQQRQSEQRDEFENSSQLQIKNFEQKKSEQRRSTSKQKISKNVKIPKNRLLGEQIHKLLNKKKEDEEQKEGLNRKINLNKNVGQIKKDDKDKDLNLETEDYYKLARDKSNEKISFEKVKTKINEKLKNYSIEKQSLGISVEKENLEKRMIEINQEKMEKEQKSEEIDQKNSKFDLKKRKEEKLRLKAEKQNLIENDEERKLLLQCAQNNSNDQSDEPPIKKKIFPLVTGSESEKSVIITQEPHQSGNAKPSEDLSSQ